MAHALGELAFIIRLFELRHSVFLLLKALTWPRRKHWRKCFALLLKATSRALVSFHPLGGLNRLTAILSHATAELANLANFEVVEN
jgi:hypothetical protein